MKLVLLAGATALGLAASASAAHAVPFDFMYTGSLVTFTVPTTDTYQILAFGAQGGSATAGNLSGVGGLGAEIGGNFGLTAGEILQIGVGGAGSNNVGGGVGGGGGGTFVVDQGNTPLVIAGGGGGGGHTNLVFMGLPGQGGLTGPDGGFQNGGTGGNGGGGGVGSFGGGGGGGGFFSAGGTGEFRDGSPAGGGGGAFPGLAGGEFGGGFGGGGGAVGGAGGGGGYSGGGGTSSPGGDGQGGGGGSFDAGTNQILVADFRTGNGEVVITELVPEPASIALLGAGLLSLAAVRRRRQPNT